MESSSLGKSLNFGVTTAMARSIRATIINFGSVTSDLFGTRENLASSPFDRKPYRQVPPNSFSI